jgi:protein-disulfide isomerase
MLDFVKRNIAFIAVVLGTVVLLVGGVFLFSKSGSSEGKVDSSLLIGKDSYQTSKGAPATLVEFGDYQCPACGSYHTLVKQMLVEFDGKLNFVFRNFPLSQHANANISSYAVEAAGLQGKYWEMHDMVFENQEAWSGSSDARTIFVGYAEKLELNIKQFNIDIDSKKIKDKVSADYADGVNVGINSTPTFFLNGVKLNQVGSYEAFKKLVQDAIDKNPVSVSEDEGAYHVHFDLKTYVNGSSVNFALSRYQESENNPLDPDIHFHDGNGKVVHVHAAGLPLSRLFNSLKITFPLDVVGYVNGKKVENILSYVPQDLDRIVVGEGPIEAVSNDACIYSLKCPERGTPPPEECVGGVGSGCEE